MRNATPVKRWLTEYRETRGWTIRKMARKLGVGYPFMTQVLNYHEPCSPRLIRRFADVLGKSKDVIGLSFGYYPSDWLWFARSYPEKALQYLRECLEKEGCAMKGQPTLRRTQMASPARTKAWLQETEPDAPSDLGQTS